MVQIKEDKFVSSVNLQLQLLQTYPLNPGSAELAKGLRAAFMVILAVSA